jgi:hypothetical protein
MMREATRMLAVMTFGLATLAALRPVQARAADDAAEAVLEARGFVRGSSGYVLRAEADALARLGTLRSRADEFNAALGEVAGLQQKAARLDVLDQAIINANGLIADLNYQMGQFPGTYRGGRLIHGNNMQDENNFQQLRAQRDALVRERDAGIVPERDTLRRDQPGQKLGPATQRLKARKEAALDALREARSAANAVRKEYDDLAGSAEVKRALGRLGRPAIGPSPELEAGIREIAVFERSVGMRPGAISATRPAVPAAPAAGGRAPDSADSKLHIAELTEKNGNLKGALKLYEEVSRLFPGSDACRKAAERVAELRKKLR